MKVLIVKGRCEEFETITGTIAATRLESQTDSDPDIEQLHFEAAVARELAGEFDE